MEYVPSSVLERAQRQTGHLRRDTNAAFIQKADGVLVPVALLAEQILAWDLDVVEVDDACAGCLDAELLLFLRDAEALGALLDDKRCDALVLLLGRQVGKHDEEVGFHAVCDPHLAAADLVPGVCLDGLGRERERIGATDGLGQAEGADGVGGELGQVLFLDGLGAPFENGRVDERVVHVAHDADAGVDARELLDGDDSAGEIHPGAAVLFRDLNAHQPLLEQLLDYRGVHGLCLVHLAGLGQDDFRGELGDGFAHHGFSLGQMCDGRWGNIGDVDSSIAAGGCGGEASYPANISIDHSSNLRAGDMAYWGVARATAGRRERRDEAVAARASGLSVLAIEDMTCILRCSCQCPKYRKKKKRRTSRKLCSAEAGQLLPIGAAIWGVGEPPWPARM